MGQGQKSHSMIQILVHSTSINDTKYNHNLRTEYDESRDQEEGEEYIGGSLQWFDDSNEHKGYVETF